MPRSASKSSIRNDILSEENVTKDIQERQSFWQTPHSFIAARSLTHTLSTLSLPHLLDGFTRWKAYETWIVRINYRRDINIFSNLCYYFGEVMMDKNAYKQLLMDRLLGYFDFEEDRHLGSIFLDFHATMHRRNEKYVLQKKNVLYAYDNFEYFNLYQADAMTLAQLQFLMETFVQESLKITTPNDEHMSSDHILIVRLQHITAELIDFARKYKYRKYFRFGLQGTFKAGLILVREDAKSATFSKDLRDNKYHFVLEK